MNFTDHVKLTEAKAKKSLRLIKALSGTNWGQQKELLCNTYKQYVRPTMEYACPAWAPATSKTNIEKLQRVQNAALRCCTGHTRDWNANYYHQETKVLPMQVHLNMLSSQYREGVRDPEHPLHDELRAPAPERDMKATALHSPHLTLVHGCDREGECEKERRTNKQVIHTETVRSYLEQRDVHPLLQMQAPDVDKSEATLPRASRRTLAQLRARKGPLLRTYLCNIGAADDPGCPLCGHDCHDVAHLFECQHIQIHLTPLDLWRNPVRAAALVDEWGAALALVEDA